MLNKPVHVLYFRFRSKMLLSLKEDQRTTPKTFRKTLLASGFGKSIYKHYGALLLTKGWWWGSAPWANWKSYAVACSLNWQQINLIVPLWMTDIFNSLLRSLFKGLKRPSLYMGSFQVLICKIKKPAMFGKHQVSFCDRTLMSKHVTAVAANPVILFFFIA